MKIAVDSSAWIEWLTGSDTAQALSDVMPSADACVVPTIVQFEVVKWLRREKGETQADAFLAYSNECLVEPLHTATAITAVAVSEAHKLAMADAVVLATDRNTGAALLTCDAHFQSLSDVIYVDKRNP